MLLLSGLMLRLFLDTRFCMLHSTCCQRLISNLILRTRYTIKGRIAVAQSAISQLKWRHWKWSHHLIIPGGLNNTWQSSEYLVLCRRFLQSDKETSKNLRACSATKAAQASCFSFSSSQHQSNISHNHITYTAYYHSHIATTSTVL